MPLKIRLTRQGRKRRPFYHIVIADSRAPRDGKYIERIGLYNPITNPATIEMNFNRALYWVQQGAQPTDTCRTLLSANGVMYKKHLLEGVKKGAFSEEEAEKRFDAWKKEKEIKLQAIKSKLKKAKDTEAKNKVEAEAKIKEAKAEEIARKNAELAEAEAKAARKVSEEVESTTENAEGSLEEPEEAGAGSEPVAVSPEEPVAEAEKDDVAEAETDDVAKAETDEIAEAETDDVADESRESSEEENESEPQDIQQPESKESEKDAEVK
jgi:small subunit ribosomal protein S16